MKGKGRKEMEETHREESKIQEGQQHRSIMGQDGRMSSAVWHGREGSGLGDNLDTSP